MCIMIIMYIDYVFDNMYSIICIRYYVFDDMYSIYFSLYVCIPVKSDIPMYVYIYICTHLIKQAKTCAHVEPWQL